MKKSINFKNVFILILALLSSSTFASEKVKKTHHQKSGGYIVTASERDKVLVLNAKEEIIREIDANNTYDASIFKNGDILFSYHRGVKIISPSDEIKFDFKSESEIFACQSIGKNKILIGECTNGRLIEVNLKGEILKGIPLSFKKGGHGCIRSARKIKNGHYLVNHYADKTVREYDKNGTVIQEFVRPNNVYAAQRLKNGNTVISDKFSLSIYNKEGQMIWEFKATEYPELGVNHLAGFQVLPNDEIIVCNWLGHKPYKKGIPIFKINLKKEILWKYHNANKTYSCTNIQVL